MVMCFLSTPTINYRWHVLAVQQQPSGFPTNGGSLAHLGQFKNISDLCKTGKV